MKRSIFAWLFLLTANSTPLSAQTQKFDVFKFQEPRGWKKDTKTGLITYNTSDEKKGTYCMIALYASKPGTGVVAQDFDDAWKTVATPLGVTEAPQISEGTETNGWKILTGNAVFALAGGKSILILNCFSGYGKTAGIMISFNDAGYQKLVESFLNTADIIALSNTAPLNNNNAANTIIPNNAGAAGFTYTAPRGWTESKTANGTIAIASPLLECKEYSYYSIQVLPQITYTGNLQQYAHDLHKSRFYEQNSWRQYMEGDKRVVKGIDKNGYEFLSYETSAALFNSDRNYHYGMVYLLRSGNQMIPVVLELRPINGDRNAPPTEILYFLAGCNPLKSAWNKFVGSVKFTAPQKAESYLPDDLLGKWESRVILGATNWGFVNSQVMEKYTFTDDGRYQSQKMMAGDNYGKYSVKGNKITITDAAGKSTSYNFKLESLFEYGAWHRELTLYDATGKETVLKWEGE
jgi:hypothetical protein